MPLFERVSETFPQEVVSSLDRDWEILRESAQEATQPLSARLEALRRDLRINRAERDLSLREWVWTGRPVPAAQAEVAQIVRDHNALVDGEFLKAGDAQSAETAERRLQRYRRAEPTGVSNTWDQFVRRKVTMPQRVTLQGAVLAWAILVAAFLALVVWDWLDLSWERPVTTVFYTVGLVSAAAAACLTGIASYLQTGSYSTPSMFLSPVIFLLIAILGLGLAAAPSAVEIGDTGNMDVSDGWRAVVAGTVLLAGLLAFPVINAAVEAARAGASRSLLDLLVGDVAPGELDEKLAAYLGSLQTEIRAEADLRRRIARRWAFTFFALGGLAALASGAAGVQGVNGSGASWLPYVALLGATAAGLVTALNPAGKWKEAETAAAGCRSLGAEVGMLEQLDFGTMPGLEVRAKIEEISLRFDAICGVPDRPRLFEADASPAGPPAGSGGEPETG